jgi:hypothetical protein
LKEGGVRPNDVERVEQAYRRQLLEQIVNWESTVLLLDCVAP